MPSIGYELSNMGSISILDTTQDVDDNMDTTISLVDYMPQTAHLLHTVQPTSSPTARSLFTKVYAFERGSTISLITPMASLIDNLVEGNDYVYNFSLEESATNEISTNTHMEVVPQEINSFKRIVDKDKMRRDTRVRLENRYSKPLF